MTGRTFLFLPESAHGPTNNCVGIASVLRGRGHRVVFAAESSWRGKLTALGFELADAGLRPRLAGLGTRIRARDGVRRAADLIEEA